MLANLALFSCFMMNVINDFNVPPSEDFLESSLIHHSSLGSLILGANGILTSLIFIGILIYGVGKGIQEQFLGRVFEQQADAEEMKTMIKEYNTLPQRPAMPALPEIEYKEVTGSNLIRSGMFGLHSSSLRF